MPSLTLTEENTVLLKMRERYLGAFQNSSNETILRYLYIKIHIPIYKDTCTYKQRYMYLNTKIHVPIYKGTCTYIQKYI